MSCVTSNFDKENQLESLLFVLELESSTLDDLSKNIMSVLKKCPFSTDINNSENSDTYDASIYDLIDEVVKKLNEKNKLKFDFKGVNITKLRSLLKDLLLPIKKSEVDLNILAVIPTVGLLSQEEVNLLKYKEVLREIYGDNYTISSFRDLEFKLQMLIRTIIDTENKSITDSVDEFNKNLMKYKSDLYLKLRDYIKTQSIDDNSFNPKLISRSYYYMGDKTSKVDNIYSMMYNYLMYLKNKGKLEQTIRSSWENKKQGKPSPFFDALNAYITLQFFDESLQNAFGKYIRINKEYDEPITTEDDLVIYKYNLSKGNTEMSHGWNTVDEQDAIKLMSGYSTILIENIPMISHKTGAPISIGRFLNLTTVQYINAIINLRSAIENLSGNENLKILLNSEGNPETKWRKIFHSIFIENNIVDSLLKLTVGNRKLLTDFDINVLYSIYNLVLNKNNPHSYSSIENNYIKTRGIRDRYSIVGTLVGIMESTAEMNYIEVSYNKDADNPGYEIKIKRKMASNTSKYDIAKAINRRTYNRTDKESLLKTYSIETSNEEQLAKLTINGNTINLKFKSHILDKKSGCTVTPKNGFESIIDNTGKLLINLGNSEVRDKFFKGDLTSEQQLFMDLLSFIDSMLGTVFSKSADGLLELNQFIRLGGTFKSLLQAATRILKIIQIYNDLDNDNDYQKTQVKSFINNKKILEGIVIEKDNEKDFLMTDLRGTYLSSVKPSADKWIEILVDARMTLNGSISKATTKDFSGNSRANYTPTYLGARLKQYLETSRNTQESFASKLLFANNPDAIVLVGNDTEIKLKDGTVKSVKDFSRSELIHHAIIDKFFLPLNSNDPVFIQPTTFSDKVKYIQYGVLLTKLGIQIFNSKISDICTEKLFNTAGEAYKILWKNIVSDYEQIFGTNNILEIEKRLHELSEQELIKLADEKGITVFEDLHYRKTKEGLTINELLYDYANNLYQSIETLTQRLNKERINFVNDLVNTLTTFSVTREPNGDLNLKDPIGNFAKHYGSTKFEADWVYGNDLILAQVTTKDNKVINILTENIDPSLIKSIKLNPLLEAYFSADTLISNNLRFSLTGSELNHPVKTGLTVAGVLAKHGIFEEDITPVQALEEIRLTLENPNSTKLEKKLAIQKKEIIRDELLYLNESNAQNTLLKRNVPIPGTIIPYIQNRIYGLPPKMRCAIIQDVQAPVQNFDGTFCETKKGYGSLNVDAHDGYAHINPITSILENNSLHDNEVSDVKKNLLHSYDYRHGTATLFKYAAGAITNRAMRDSELSPIRLLNLFKKMNNERWSVRNPDGTIKWNFAEDGKTGKIDLTKSDYKKSIFDFSVDILLGSSLFYESRGKKLQIIDFNIENGDYYTEELEVVGNGDPAPNSTLIRYYHYFDNNGKHIKSPTPIENKFDEFGNEIIHTIDSLYELFLAMGGIKSLELQNIKGEKVLVESEASIKTVTAFVNYVANKVSAENNLDIDLINYDLPLKRAMISYIVNKTAIKNGTGNINPVSSYYDDTPLKTIEVETRGHGVQQDSDHIADEAEMTEPTLVITALDAGGRIHNYVKQIYEAIGRIIIEACSVELDAVKEFRSTGNKTKLYDFLGRVVMNNIKEGNKGLLKAIMTEIKKNYNINADHINDLFKIAFSDSNIYSLILSTLTSIINRKAITRKYPGNGMVMIPGYDIETVFELDGIEYQYPDLLKLAKVQISKETLDRLSKLANDDSHFDRLLVLELLALELSQEEITYKTDWINPADIINVHVNNKESQDVKLNTIEDYYSFKHGNTRKFLARKLYGVEISEEYNKEWRPTKDNSHLNPDGTVKTNRAFAITLKGVKGYFEIVKDHEDHFWSIHFKTGIEIEEGITIPDPNFTEELKDIMFKAAALVIPKGDYLSTYGYLTPGGVSGLDRFEKLGFIKIGERPVFDRDGNPINIPIYQSNVDIAYQKNITKPRNLKPVEIIIRRADGTLMNVFDTEPIKQLYFTGVRDKKAILQMFDDLAKGEYLGELVEIIKNEAAECIVPNVYQSNFNIPANMSLVEALNSSSVFKQQARLINSTHFDIAFTKNNGRNTYITFKPILDNSDTFNSRILPWNNVQIKEVNSPKYVNSIIALDDDNMPLFEVGREVIVDDVVWDDQKKYRGSTGAFTDVNGKILDNLNLYKRYKDGKILKSIYFILKRIVQEKTKKLTNKYILYNINISNLRKVYDSPKEEDSKEVIRKTMFNYVGKLMSDIYNSEDFNGVLLNNSMTLDCANILKASLTEFASRQAHNQLLYNLILGDGKKNGLLLLLLKATVEETDYKKEDSKKKIKICKISVLENKKILNNYYTQLGTEIKASFKKSLYFTSSRIPAQSLQSFMKMRAVGFTRGNLTHTYVSHFQTWLLGSDYKLILNLKLFKYIK